MGDLDVPVGRVPGTEKELQERSRLNREDRERFDAMAKAEEAGRAAADEEPWDIPEESKVRFGSRLTQIDARSDGIPRVDTVVQDDARLVQESTQRARALRNAERMELRPEVGQEDSFEPRA